VLVVSIILAILEHFIDTEDFTSDDGLHGGPEDIVGEDPLRIASRVLTLPMSAGNHIYQPRHEDLLALRAYAGKWGGHDGIVDKSPPFARRKPAATSASCSTRREAQKSRLIRRVMPTRTPYWSGEPCSVIGESAASPTKRS
jgi:hypothetical protein